MGYRYRKQLNLRVTDDVDIGLNREADRLGLSKSSVARMILKKGCRRFIKDD